MDFVEFLKAEEESLAAFENAIKSTDTRYMSAASSELTSSRSDSITSITPKNEFDLALLLSSATKKMSATPEGASVSGNVSKFS